MLDFRQFLFRSPERDEETDRQRVALLRQAVRSAVESAEKESEGLRHRLEKARQSAAFLLDEMDDGIPEAAREAELTMVEQRLVGAERRLAELSIQLASLRKIESMVDGAFEPLVTAGTAAQPRIEPNPQTGD
jgi:hypothetical protein